MSCTRNPPDLYTLLREPIKCLICKPLGVRFLPVAESPLMNRSPKLARQGQTSALSPTCLYLNAYPVSSLGFLVHTSNFRGTKRPLDLLPQTSSSSRIFITINGNSTHQTARARNVWVIYFCLFPPYNPIKSSQSTSVTFTRFVHVSPFPP